LSRTNSAGSRKREVEPTALLTPADARRLGVAEGGRVTLGNAQGQVTLRCKLAEGQQDGVIVVESIWPNGDWAEGMGINLLVSDEPTFPNGGAVFHDTALALVVLEASAQMPLAAE
jgi:anaerobic selenocysteine-containing dehydrogenase